MKNWLPPVSFPERAIPTAPRAAPLYNEARLDPMEGEAVVEAAPREVEEGHHGEGRLHRVQVDLDAAVAGEEEGARRVERHPRDRIIGGHGQTVIVGKAGRGLGPGRG